MMAVGKGEWIERGAVVGADGVLFYSRLVLGPGAL